MIEHRSPCRTCGHTARHVLMAEWMCDQCRGPCRAPDPPKEEAGRV